MSEDFEQVTPELAARALDTIRKSEAILAQVVVAIDDIRRIVTEIVNLDPQRICPACRLGAHQTHQLCMVHGGCQCKEGARA